jgi:hypothetical protein
MGIAAPLLLFLMACSLYAQTNCPTPEHSAPIPLALVSSPLMRVRLPLSQSVLTVPNRVDVDVKATLKASRVELWTGSNSGRGRPEPTKLNPIADWHQTPTR